MTREPPSTNCSISVSQRGFSTLICRREQPWPLRPIIPSKYWVHPLSRHLLLSVMPGSTPTVLFTFSCPAVQLGWAHYPLWRCPSAPPALRFPTHLLWFCDPLLSLVCTSSCVGVFVHVSKCGVWAPFLCQTVSIQVKWLSNLIAGRSVVSGCGTLFTLV